MWAQRERQMPCWAESRTWDSILGHWDRVLSRRQTPNHLSHPGAPCLLFILFLNSCIILFSFTRDPALPIYITASIITSRNKIEFPIPQGQGCSVFKGCEMMAVWTRVVAVGMQPSGHIWESFCQSVIVFRSFFPRHMITYLAEILLKV